MYNIKSVVATKKNESCLAKKKLEHEGTTVQQTPTKKVKLGESPCSMISEKNGFSNSINSVASTREDLCGKFGITIS